MAEQSSPICALSLLALMSGCGHPLAETLGLIGERWVLSGHHPPAGATVESTYAMSLHDGEMAQLDAPPSYGSIAMEARMTLRETYISAAEIERVVVEDQMRRVTRVNGEEHVDEESDPLVGVALIGQASGSGGWSWRLKAGLPTEEQREALADLEESESVLPTEPVGIGDVWEVSAAALLGASAGNLTKESGAAGAGRMKLTGLSERGGEPCAELVFVSDHLTLLAEDLEPQLTLALRGSSCVSLSTGEELVYEAEGWLSTGLPNSVTGDGVEGPTVLLGVVELTGSSRVTVPAGAGG